MYSSLIICLFMIYQKDTILDTKDPDYTPSFITLNEKPADRVSTDKHHLPELDGLHPKNELIESAKGKLEHTMELDGKVDICFGTAEGSKVRHLRFGVRVIEKTDFDPDVYKESKEDQKEADKVKVSSHLSHMEMELHRVQMGMDKVFSEADFAKERDSLFHKNTQSMHAATIYWPILQVCVLIMTGFTQATHIVRFFKSRRII